MKKLNLLLVAAFMSIGMLAVSCGSGSDSKNETDSIAQKGDFGDPNAEENKPSRVKETISYGGKFKEVSGARITKESIKAATKVKAVFIEMGNDPLMQATLISGDIPVKYDGAAEFIYAKFEDNPLIAEEFGVSKNDVPVIIVADKEGNVKKFTGEKAKAEAEEAIKGL